MCNGRSNNFSPLLCTDLEIKIVQFEICSMSMSTNYYKLLIHFFLHVCDREKYFSVVHSTVENGAWKISKAINFETETSICQKKTRSLIYVLRIIFFRCEMIKKNTICFSHTYNFLSLNREMYLFYYSSASSYQ